ncbi:hypothetical protein BTA51_09900 [Hahella sp. CCB-MM4]|nr:hypothetical protein BTA51_09900 [Hahella sp. CCB-MM4]
MSEKYSLEEYEGMPIGKVFIESLPVFNEDDPDEDYFIYRLLNKIHVLTRTDVISNQLLFNSGDTLQVDKLEESERILRNNPYLIDARIIPFRKCDEKIDLLVITRDIWTLEPGVKFSHTDGNSRMGIELSDNNILGTGNRFSVSYNKDDDRSSIDYLVGAHQMFGSHVDATVRYGDTSDGERKSFSLERPFYALDTRWAAGGDLFESSREDSIKSGSEETNSYRHEVNTYNLYFGLSDGLQGDDVKRWYYGLTKEEDLFSPISATEDEIPEDRMLLYPWVAYERIENLFATYRNLHYIETTEDVSLGKHIYLKLGYGGQLLDNDRSQGRYEGNYSDAYSFGEHHLFFVGAHMDGYWDEQSGAPENSIFGTNLSYIHLTDERHRWFFGFKADIGSHLDEDKELTLNNGFGMRGFPGGYERGNRRFVATVERRFYSGTHIFNLFRVGNVFFLDVGRAWQTGETGDSPILFDVGVGMRLISSKARTGNVVHLDLAVPLNERANVDSFQWTLKAYNTF